MPQFDNIINPTTSYDTVEGNGTPVTPRLILNFSGVDFTVVDDAGNSRTNVILPPMVHIAGSTMTGNLILNGDPTLPLQAATKEYVDSLAAGLTPIAAVVYASTGAYTATYNNGASGVGATLTNATTQAAFSIDSNTPSVNDRVLIKDQAAPAQNGIYTVTTVGDGSHNWVLTRATDYDTTAKIKTGTYTVASAGTVNAGNLFIMTTSGTITVGTTAIVWSLFSSASSISVTAPLTKVGNVIGLTTPLAATYGGTGVSNSNNITLGGDLTTGGAFTTTPANPLTFTTTGATNVTLPTTGTLVNTAVTTLSSLASIGIITTAVWNASLISPTYGGTGINNGSSTITLGGNLTFSGAHTTTFTVTGNTALTLPTSGTVMVGSNNLSELTNTTTARSNLGLGTAATHAATDFLLAANNLSDVANASTSRTNLGLGTMATQNASAVAITGGTLSGVTITSPRIVTGLLDANGNNMITFGPTGGATSYIEIDNSVGGGTAIVARGPGNGNLTLYGQNGGVVNAISQGTVPFAITPSSGSQPNGILFSVPTITAERTLTFQDASGTVALVATSLQTGNNLSDLSNADTARMNLALDVCFYQIVRQVFTTSGTYTPTSGMVFCDVELLGGGAAAGGVATASAGQCAVSGGGGVGGYSRKILTAAQIGVSQTITIGSGGTSTAGFVNGGDGGITSLGSLFSANGGHGGGGSPSSISPATNGGLGGVGVGGDFNTNGALGFSGFGFGATNFAASGQGGSSLYGCGGTDRIWTSAGGSLAGLDALNYGSGGGGAITTSGGTQQAGGNGSPGLCIITEYIKRG